MATRTNSSPSLRTVSGKVGIAAIAFGRLRGHSRRGDRLSERLRDQRAVQSAHMLLAAVCPAIDLKLSEELLMDYNALVANNAGERRSPWSTSEERYGYRRKSSPTATGLRASSNPGTSTVAVAVADSRTGERSGQEGHWVHSSTGPGHAVEGLRDGHSSAKAGSTVGRRLRRVLDGDSL